MGKPANESCASCHFGLPAGDTVQACHRNAPRPVQTLTAEPANGRTKAELRWPAVSASDWCGEYQANRAKTER